MEMFYTTPNTLSSVIMVLCVLLPFGVTGYLTFYVTEKVGAPKDFTFQTLKGYALLFPILALFLYVSLYLTTLLGNFVINHSEPSVHSVVCSTSGVIASCEGSTLREDGGKYIMDVRGGQTVYVKSSDGSITLYKDKESALANY